MSDKQDRVEAVDIILPTHSRPHTVGYAIESVLAQTHSIFYLHILGDGCDAQTESLIRSFEDPRIHFYRFPKGTGYGYAHRNTILRQTVGKYVAYMTDDDLWFPDHLERGLSKLEGDNLGLVAFRSCCVEFPDRVNPNFFAFDWQTKGTSKLLPNWFIGSVECIHRRTVFEHVGYWNEQLLRFGDREFYNRVRNSRLPSEYLDYVSVLRFYARHWDERYASVSEVPQKRYSNKLRNSDWCRELRAKAAPGPRSFNVRWRQWRDFVIFGIRSGPKFIRFLYQTMLRT